MNPTKKYLLTGITPSGNLTIANYIGAIQNLMSLQKEGYSSIIFIADLHSITTNVDKIDTKSIKEKSFDMACFYKAMGLDTNDNILFLQSDVNYHTELSYILMCHTNLGELERMTQFKDKSIKNQNKTFSIPSGLLYYPILMAADIILYKPNIIPVGQDQKQHVELTKRLMDKMRKYYNIDLPNLNIHVPKVGYKINSLISPTTKMSKSSTNEKSYISLLDTPEAIIKKIKSAVTDSENLVKYDVENKPGISNLLNIYSALTNESISSLENKYKNKSYSEFKQDLANIIIDTLKPIQQKYYEYKQNPQVIFDMLDKGAQMAREIAKNNIEEFKNQIFLKISK